METRSKNIPEKKRIRIIGGGAMGSAFARGILDSGMVDGSSITISDPHPLHLEDLEEKGVRVFSSNTEALKENDLIIIAVKPWLVREVVTEIESRINYDKTELCFIVAGIPSSELFSMFTMCEPKKISIAIPNTAMVKRESMTFMVPVAGNKFEAETYFKSLGKVMFIEERLLPAATALASCGIAYAMRYVRAACEGGVELGFKASAAQEIVVQTLAGAVAILSEKGTHPESEIDKVTTPGGITIRGLNAMERNGFTNAVIEGLKASR